MYGDINISKLKFFQHIISSIQHILIVIKQAFLLYTRHAMLTNSLSWSWPWRA